MQRYCFIAPPPQKKIAGQENTLNKINWKPFAILINENFVSLTSTKNELSPSPTNVFSYSMRNIHYSYTNTKSHDGRPFRNKTTVAQYKPWHSS